MTEPVVVPTERPAVAARIREEHERYAREKRTGCLLIEAYYGQCVPQKVKVRTDSELKLG